MKDKKMKKLIKKVVYAVIYAILIILLSIVSIQKFSNNNLSLFGYRIFRVISESMLPEYQINDIIMVKKVDIEKIGIGNNISYLKKLDENREIIITHKVIRIEQDYNGNKIFHTKGIVNTVEDPIVREEQIYGVAIYKMYLLSFINKLVSNKYGFVISIIIPIVILIYLNLKELITIVKENDDEK